MFSHSTASARLLRREEGAGRRLSLDLLYQLDQKFNVHPGFFTRSDRFAVVYDAIVKMNTFTFERLIKRSSDLFIRINTPFHLFYIHFGW